MVRPVRTTHTADIVDPVVVRRSRDLLERAELLFDNADGIEDSAERFRQYYLTALRAAGAAIEVYEPSNRPARRRGSRNAWNRLTAVAPELADAVGFFAAHSSTRSDIESGLRRSVGADIGITMRRHVIELLDAVEELLIAYEQGKLPDQMVSDDRTA
ncbi:SAV_6107 family HEPN domain-containing protein [Gordonia sp. NPDC003424]